MCYTGMILAGVFLVTGAGGASDVDEAFVQRKVASLQESAGPRHWRQVPWVASLLEARRLSQIEQVPVFLFTYDGNIDSGRC